LDPASEDSNSNEEATLELTKISRIKTQTALNPSERSAFRKFSERETFLQEHSVFYL
jgi:hypothetical protein